MKKEYLGLNKDGTYYEAPGEAIFITSYEANWEKVMSTTYFPSEKIDVGHKLRPRLVYWGFLSCRANADDDEIDLLGKLAVSIELIHKASLLIDDYIDQDTARHGRPAFYVEYGVERTIIYSLNLLSTALRLMNNVFAKKENSTQYFNSMESIISMLDSMTKGVLKELDLGTLTTHSLRDIQEIMILETAELITSSLVSGYSLAGGENKDSLNLLSSVGQKVGFVFQILNDLEPFTELNHDHKGSINIDVGRRRKNYCIAILNELITKREKKLLDQLVDTELEKLVLQLINKYDIINLLLKECRKTFLYATNELQNTNFDQQWKENFCFFLESVYSVSCARLDKCH